MLVANHVEIYDMNLQMRVLDHIVIGDRRFVSLKERGLGFG